MSTIDSLTGPAASVFWPTVLAAVAVALPTSALSVVVVPKRLAFLGQGITHAAFGGVGIAAVLGLSPAPGFAVVAAFCLLAALAIGAATRRGGLDADTAIAVVLVASMALGAILVHLRLTLAGPAPMAGGWESLLFGSIVAVSPADARLAWAVAGVVLAALAIWRRPILFWACDEQAAESFGAAAGAARMGFLALCALAIVTAMKLAGVVLVTALLVLPGATAARLSKRLGVVVALALGVGVAGALGGLVLAFEADLPAGPAIVTVHVAVFAASWVVSRAAGAGRNENLHPGRQ